MANPTKRQRPEVYELYCAASGVLQTNGAMRRDDLIKETKAELAQSGYSTYGVVKELNELLGAEPWGNVVQVEPGRFDYVDPEGEARRKNIEAKLSRFSHFFS